MQMTMSTFLMRLFLAAGSAVFAAQLDAHELDRSFRRINAPVHRILRSSMQKDMFSHIGIDRSRKCSAGSGQMCSRSRCTLRQKHDEQLGGPTVDLRKFPESYSPHARNGAAIWRALHDMASSNPFLSKMLSGLHLSVTVHISRNFVRLFGGFLPNSLYYFKRCSDDYKRNLYTLYSYVGASVYVLCRKYGVEEIFPSESQRLTKASFCMGRDAIQTLDRMIDVLSCIDCERCRLWGEVQIRGLMVATRVHMDNESRMEPGDIVRLARLFSCLCSSVAEIETLESAWGRYFSMLMVYRAELLYTLLGFCIFLFLRRKR